MLACFHSLLFLVSVRLAAVVTFNDTGASNRLRDVSAGIADGQHRERRVGSHIARDYLLSCFNSLVAKKLTVVIASIQWIVHCSFESLARKIHPAQRSIETTCVVILTRTTPSQIQ